MVVLRTPELALQVLLVLITPFKCHFICPYEMNIPAAVPSHPPLTPCSQWALQLQQSLLEVEWPSALLDEPEMAELGDDGAVLHRGLRASVGVHCGEPHSYAWPDGKTEYFGPTVVMTARIASLARAGEILLSGCLWEQIQGCVDM